jgi:hypothetical protein
MRQPVDRDDEDVVLDAFDPSCANEAHDAQGAIACPSSPASHKPNRLLADLSDVAPVVRSGLRLDRKRQSRPGRWRPSRCLPDPDTAASGAAASPLPAAASGRAGRRPPSERPPGCDRRARASGERRGRARARRGAAARRAPPLPCRRQPARATPRRRSPRPPGRRVKVADTAVDVRSSTRILARRWIRRWLGRPSGQPTFGLFDRGGQPSRLLAGRQQRRLADRLARRGSLPPITLPTPSGEPFPLPPTPRTMRSPLLTPRPSLAAS